MHIGVTADMLFLYKESLSNMNAETIKQLKEQVESMLPKIKNGELSGEEIEQISSKVRAAIKEDPSVGKQLGQLVALISAAVKSQTAKIDMTWVPVGGGFLSIGHKPGGKLPFDAMKQNGTSVILTLLHENEGAEQIGQQTSKAQLTWVWFPFSASRPHTGNAVTDVVELYNSLQALLDNGNRIYIHCSAGIHRTGMITYGLLRYMGNTEAEAKEMLLQLRPVTSAQVGDERLQWGDQFGK